jgi:phosphonate transport system substrate-binding protein
LIPIRQLELFKTRTQVANDSSLSEAEKAEKLKAVDDQLAALASQAKS